MIPFLFALTFLILLTFAFVIPCFFLFGRWVSILATDDFNIGDMKVPTFYSSKQDGNGVTYIFFMSFFGVVFGGIHCAEWFFHFPSSDEAMLWRVCSAALTCIALLLPLVYLVVNVEHFKSDRWEMKIFAFFTIILLVYNVTSSFVSSRGFHLP